MKKILGLSIAALLVLAMVGGGTWAYFSDTESSAGNTLMAGTLDLGLANSSNTSSTGSTTGTWAISNWKPGDTKPGTLYINNHGTIPMSSVNVTFSYGSIVDGTPLTVHNIPGGDTDNITRMIVASTVLYPDGSTHVATMEGHTLEYLNTNGPFALGSLAASTEKPLAITWTLNSSATNGCQGDSIDVTVTVDAIQ